MNGEEPGPRSARSLPPPPFFSLFDPPSFFLVAQVTATSRKPLGLAIPNRRGTLAALFPPPLFFSFFPHGEEAFFFFPPFFELRRVRGKKDNRGRWES